MPELLIKSGVHQGKRLVLPQPEVIIGREKECQIRIGSSDVSRQHCRLFVTEEGILIRDLGSQNGTVVNDVTIEGEVLLKAGDEIRVGPMIFQIPAKRKAQTKIVIPTEPAAPTNKANASDDDILDWLSKDEISGEIPKASDETSMADTTVIPPLPGVKSSKISAKPVSPSSSTMISTDNLSVPDAAAAIIQKHWEKVRAQEKEAESATE